MTHPIIKLLLPWFLIIGALFVAYYLFSQRPSVTNDKLHTQSQAIEEQPQQGKKQTEKQQSMAQAEAKHLEQGKVIKQRLLEEFENAFFKQYTPPIGCENWNNESHMVRCTSHQIKAKQEFKQEFIKKRGLPKDTFDQPQLSFTD